MTTGRTHTELKFSGDSRFISGIRAAVEFIAARDGLGDADRESLGAAWETVARNCITGLSEQHPLCRVLIDDFDDRMEVRLEHPSFSAPGFGATTVAAGMPDESHNLDITRRVDRVLYDARNGTASVTLVKFFTKKPPAS
ncbi:MAG TPA: hypothetical protein VGR72_01930 [Candidatus Acidoferrales bacterium]|nr:hypothetical protein [Candidatus Acidoferrales bacterium]